MNNNLEQPIPQGKYLPAVRNADLIYSSGMTPRKVGKLMFSGKVNTNNSIEYYREAVRLATSNALVAIEACMNEDEKISLIIQLHVYINAEDGFTSHSKIADYASEYLIEKLGNSGIGSRVAIGVATLPSDAPIEISMVGKVV